ncbi:SusC/RagA family TonB-linked outer membrane protein [Spirosoma utsteinense]|uniref:TonB-linked SusC/RagA family outer membrane protein n=1 Tax=Spirosoma utsteinense TaxID=2585773 RepID=A0ABR6W1J7_9BACT|nr:SusC/RagA family TonB-linked outer membrane protein [Spirosoma utsteinense]MBC3786608.1 TonB-linked SusC/RagA family outer membrane protein [Spirosoma utsteinense]MBC3789986.1 TonB-linked SusC/RagA family outer membrane protein [Spirosoma utsteinense]
MFKHLLSCLVVLLLATGSLWAQDQSITGLLRDEQDQAISGANVVIKGTSRGTTTDAAGEFRLAISGANTVLTVSSVGYVSKDVTVSPGQSRLTVVLASDDRVLGEVVVTALGIKRDAKALSYATQTIKPAQINEVRDGNVLNTLQGKIAGAYITQGSGGPGTGSRIVLRGNRSIQGSNNALMVVDGVPINNSTFGQATNDFGSVANSDGASNINPDDIENVTVLRGASAAALYGSQAANGVILITTKRGKTGRVSVDVNAGVSVDKPFSLPAVQNQYGQGVGGKLDPAVGSSWGAAMTGQSYTNYLDNAASYAAQPNNIRDFFRTAVSLNNSIGITGGSERSQTYFSYTNNSLQGTVPGNNLNRNTVNLRLSNQISSKLSTDAKVTYINQSVVNKPRTGEENAPVINLYQIPRNVSLSDAKNYASPNAFGQPAPTAWPSTLSSIYQNPYWMVNETAINQYRDRVIGFVLAKYQLTDFLSIQGRANLDKYFDKNEESYGQGTILWANQAGGKFSRNNIVNTQSWYDLLIEGKNKLGPDFTLDYQAGAIIQDTRYQSTNALADGLNVPNRFNLNFGTNQSLTDDFTRIQTQSLFGQVSLAWRDAIFVNASLRNDWASTLPKPYSFQYPSIGASVVLSDLLKLSGPLSFLKINGSYAQVGNGADAYLLQTNYSYGQGAGSGFISRDGTQAIGNLKPEITKSLEVGVDARFFSNRIGATITAYKTNSINQLLKLGLAPASGFKDQYINAGDIRNMGLEIVINGTAIKTDRFSWDLGLNMGLNRNKIVSLSPDIKTAFLSGGFGRSASPIVKEGGSYGDIVSYRWQKDATTGQYLVGSQSTSPAVSEASIVSTGLPVATKEQEYIGNFNPKMLLGLTNTFTFKGFSLRVLVDGRMGGIAVSGTEMNLAFSGIPEVTAKNREGGWILPAVTAGVAGSDGVTTVGAGRPNAQAITAEQFWQTVSGKRYGWGEFFAYDATNVRLRELSIGYGIPVPSNFFIKSARLSFVARNLFWIYRGSSILDIPGIGKRKMWFDPDVNIGNGNFQGVEYGTLPSNRSVGLNLKLSF